MNPKSLVKIIPPKEPGLKTGVGTIVLDEHGRELEAVTDITVTFNPDEVITAYLSIAVEMDDTEAEMVLNLDSVREWADYYGYDLVRKSQENLQEESVVEHIPLRDGIVRRIIRPFTQED